MLTFVTAVRHPQNSASYERVGELLDATLRSVCRQTSADFRVVVVCNRRPEVSVRDSRIEYIEVGFPPPSQERTPVIEYNAGIVDKGAKLAIGVVAARVHSPDHVMFMDCDDLLNHRLAEWANGAPRHPGWYSPSGYLHTVGTSFVQPMSADFHRKCGTSAIIRTDLLPVPSDLQLDSEKEHVIDSVGSTDLYRLLGTHGKWEDHLAVIGETIEPLPFSAAIWMIGTGENASGNLQSSRARTPIGSEITEEFGLEAPSKLSGFVRQTEIFLRRVVRRVRR